MFNFKKNKNSSTKPSDFVQLAQFVFAFIILAIALCNLSIGCYRLTKASADILLEIDNKNYIDNSN